MVEWMLEDASRAYDFRYVALRYFNVAGADPQGRLGQSTPNATHLIKRGVQTALGIYPSLEIFGEDYPTRDGTCVRDYIQVTDLIDAHLAALAYLRDGGASLVCNCGYGHGQTVREVVDVVKRVSGVDFKVVLSPRRPGDPAVLVARAERARSALGWKPARDNLDEIVRQALDWERRLHNRRRRRQTVMMAVPADDLPHLHRSAFSALHRRAIQLSWRQTSRGNCMRPGDRRE